MVEWSIAAVLKTVEARASGGSNPSLCAKKNTRMFSFSYFYYSEYREGFEGGSRFAGAKTLCLTLDLTTISPTAKATIDNCRAGRAAKSVNPSLSAPKNTRMFSFSYFLLFPLSPPVQCRKTAKISYKTF